MTRTASGIAKLAVGFLVLSALVLLPLYGSQYTVTTFVRIMYFGFLAMSVGMLVGQGGMISLTQTAFFGLTGYVIGLLGVERKLAFPIPELCAAGAVLVVAIGVGLIVMRTHKIVFLMLTLAFGQIFWSFARQNTSLLHGWAGIRGIRPFTLLGIDFTQSGAFYWAALVLFLLGLLLLWLITRSPFGLVLRGIRESPARMSALGYPVYRVRIAAFVISALYAGMGGIIAVYATGIVTPTTIQLSRTIWILLVVILGGANYFWGPVLGTVIAVWLDVIVSQITPRYNTVIGVVFLAVVLLAPNGILGFLDEVRKGVRLQAIRRLFRRIANVKSSSVE